MRVAVWPCDDHGCGHYRLRWPAEALIAQGADVVVDRRGPVILWSHSWEGRDTPPTNTHAVAFQEPYEADVVVMQRPAMHAWREVIPLLQAQGTRVVVDMDDLFDGVEKTHIAHKEYQSVAVNHRYVDECCRIADLVTVSTPALLSRYGYGHGVVLPNLVPEAYLSIWGLKRPETVGWSGLVVTHPGDLKSTDGGIASAIIGTDWSFHVIGSPDAVAQELGLPSTVTGRTLIEGNKRTGEIRRSPEVLPTEQLTSTGQVPFVEYASQLAELEIGVVPLKDSPFNRAKSALKAIEMAAVGVPVVMAPTPDNLRVHKQGIGLVAESRGQWKRLVSRLMGSVDGRYEMAEQGREVMATQTYEQHCGRWLDAWEGSTDRAPHREAALSSL